MGRDHNPRAKHPSTLPPLHKTTTQEPIACGRDEQELVGGGRHGHAMLQHGFHLGADEKRQTGCFRRGKTAAGHWSPTHFTERARCRKEIRDDLSNFCQLCRFKSATSSLKGFQHVQTSHSLSLSLRNHANIDNETKNMKHKVIVEKENAYFALNNDIFWILFHYHQIWKPNQHVESKTTLPQRHSWRSTNAV